MLLLCWLMMFDVLAPSLNYMFAAPSDANKLRYVPESKSYIAKLANRRPARLGFRTNRNVVAPNTSSFPWRSKSTSVNSVDPRMPTLRNGSKEQNVERILQYKVTDGTRTLFSTCSQFVLVYLQARTKPFGNYRRQTWLRAFSKVGPNVFIKRPQGKLHKRWDGRSEWHRRFTVTPRKSLLRSPSGRRDASLSNNNESAQDLSDNAEETNEESYKKRVAYEKAGAESVYMVDNNFALLDPPNNDFHIWRAPRYTFGQPWPLPANWRRNSSLLKVWFAV